MDRFQRLMFHDQMVVIVATVPEYMVVLVLVVEKVTSLVKEFVCWIWFFALPCFLIYCESFDEGICSSPLLARAICSR